MKIVCDSCGAKYSIADEKVAGKIFRIRCKKCTSVLEVRGDQAGAHPFAETGAAHDAGPSDATWYIVVDGEQKGPLPPIELSQLFAKGTVGLDSYVWKEGFDDWKVASDVPELAQIFGGSAPGTDGSDDTSAFGTGGDLFSEGGREPTSEIDTNSSMFAGFDDAPTPTENEGSPLAASAAADAGSGAAGVGAGAVAAAAPQKMTGQRNENSVLFSLSNLQQLASRGGGSAAESASPALSQPQASGGAQAGPQAAAEGSGLIDIRALAKSTTPGTKTAPSQSVDDLLAIGTGAGGTLGAPLLGPAPLETSDGNRWLWIAGAAIAVIAIVGAGVGVGMALGGSEDDALEIAAPVPTPVASESSTSANEIAEPEAPVEPEQEAAVVDIEAEEPVAAATLEEPEATKAPERAAPRTRSSSSSAQRRQRTASASRQEAPPKRKSNNLDALMDEVVGGSSSPSKPQPTRSTSSSSGSSLPDAPSRNDVKTALQGVSGAVKSCRADTGGTATVDVTFSGKTGRATGAKVASGPFKGTPVGSCIESAVKRARVPRFKQSSFKVTFPYRL
jgi:predicted Zn finger-like uncharacterized protein